MDFNWLTLQNGSDIRGIASDSLNGPKVNLTPDRIRKIAHSFC